MTEDRRAKKLEQIRALLAKAESTEFEGEAQVFRAKANQLMDAFVVEEWELAALDDGGKSIRTPEKRMYAMTWYRDDFGNQLWDLLCVTAKHCRVGIANMYFTGREIPIVGIAPDLDYMDMLFTSLMLELLKRVQPHPSPDLSYEENLAMLREAGLPWPEITVRMYEGGRLPFADEVRTSVEANWPNRNADEIERAIKSVLKNKVKWYGKCAHAYRGWCRKNDVPQNYVNQRTYRRNFAYGFVSRCRERLAEMRREEDNGDGNHQALVLRDIRHVVDDALLDEFPNQAKKQAVAKYARRDSKIDWAARSQGKKAANDVNMAVHQDRAIGKRKELPR